MENFEDFEAVFGSGKDVAFAKEDIRKNRSALEGELFIDRLLRDIGLRSPSKVYPPGSPQELQRLHQKIVENGSPDHHKQSLIYYLLKDLRHSLQGRAVEFAQYSYLPDKYKIFVDGIWYLDRLKFERALNLFTEPVLIPTYAEDILYTLCRHAPENDSTLPLAYYHTASVSITSNKVLEAFFMVLCRTSITEAFFYSRSRGEFIHRSLFERLIKFVLTNCQGNSRASKSVELVTLPLDETEESWLEEHLEEGDGKKSQGAADTLIMRAMITGRFDAVQSQSEYSRDRTMNGLNWAGLRDGMDRFMNNHGLAT